jgi:EAL domain-containing protein (putative c-di-GMP-specific phosphodiesterase class I)/CheY-like chemotaxis protein
VTVARQADTAPRGEQPAVVLVVDDDESLRTLFSFALSDAGYEVLTAADGDEALAILTRTTVDLVLLDNRMPGRDGPSTLAAIRSNPRTAELSVIFLSGSVEVSDRVRSLDEGANDYLLKPLELDELVARVRAHLRGRDVWRRRLDESLRGRARISEALGKVRLGTSAEETAAAVCARLAGLREGTGAAVVCFTADDGCIALGSYGPGQFSFEPGERLSRPLAAHLLERASTGSWVERRDAQPAGAIGVPLAGPSVAAAAYVPLQADGSLLGVLAMSADETTEGGQDAVLHVLSAAIDFAPVVAALLGPNLVARDETETRRQRIRRIIVDRMFRPVFQPIIDLEGRKTVGYEALTRFDSGRPPERVFAEAAMVGLGVELEVATAREAIAAADELPEGAWLSLNISPAFLVQADRLRPVLSAAKRPIVLELTEHDPITDYDGVLAAIAELEDDLRLSVDDAGAGYSCLHHILALRPAFVKLDRGWVSGIEADPARQALVAGLGMFAERTEGHLIAEGIEEQGELETLSELAVTLGQGYLLGRPAAASTHHGGAARPESDRG